jgi:hypothetical protein
VTERSPPAEHHDDTDPFISTGPGPLLSAKPKPPPAALANVCGALSPRLCSSTTCSCQLAGRMTYHAGCHEACKDHAMWDLLSIGAQGGGPQEHKAAGQPGSRHEVKQGMPSISVWAAVGLFPDTCNTIGLTCTCLPQTVTA